MRGFLNEELGQDAKLFQESKNQSKDPPSKGHEDWELDIRKEDICHIDFSTYLILL